MAAIARFALPLFVSVTTLGALVVPTVREPNERLLEVSETAGAGRAPATPERPTEYVAPPALIVRLPANVPPVVGVKVTSTLQPVVGMAVPHVLDATVNPGDAAMDESSVTGNRLLLTIVTVCGAEELPAVTLAKASAEGETVKLLAVTVTVAVMSRLLFQGVGWP